MSIAALTLYTALAGVILPHALRRSRWPHRAPRPAVLAWQGLMLSFTVSAALLVNEVVSTERHVRAGLLGLLSTCGVGAAGGAGVPATGTAALVALLVPMAVGALPAGWFAVAVVRSRRFRRRHAELLDLVARPLPDARAVVLEHPVPAAYCLPGRAARVVLTKGALHALTPEQVGAVLDHERAHIACRHHLVIAAAEAFARAFPLLPLSRHVGEQTALLLEMAADDRVLRTHSREALATAMCEVASAQVPPSALAAGGASAVTRVRRLLSPAPAPHPAVSLAIAAAALAGPFLPLLLACGSPA